MSRPPLISSRVAAFLASMAGLWNEVAATSGPSWIALGDGRNGCQLGPRLPRPPSGLRLGARVVGVSVQEVVTDPDRVEPDLLGRECHLPNIRPARTHSTSGSWTPTFIGLSAWRDCRRWPSGPARGQQETGLYSVYAIEMVESADESSHLLRHARHRAGLTQVELRRWRCPPVDRRPDRNGSDQPHPRNASPPSQRRRAGPRARATCRTG